MTKKTLDERAEEVRDAVCTADVRGWPAGRCPLPEVVAAYEAEREARLAAEARVRELEAERSAWASSAGRWAGEATAQEDARHVAEAGLSVSEAVRRHDEADLAATRAQLERLREAALMLADRVRAEGGHGHRVHELSDRVLAALSTPGPTLASVRAEALRDAARRWMADHENSTSAEHVHDWLRQRADDLEAGRE